MSGTWHLIGVFKNGHAKPHCAPGFDWWPASQIERQLRPQDDALTFLPERATCAACIEAYETAPVAVTSADLLELLDVLTSSDHDAAAVRVLRDRLARPRRIPQPSPAVTRDTK